ncbi:MAG: hypothetical protein ACYSUN_08455 [Planctomycetota bacterium]|jgi:DNA-binding NtrC family response regulator
MCRVLVIDDETWGGGNIPGMLRGAGHTVLEASSGKAGLKLYEEQGAEVVVFNLVSTEGRGLDTIVELCSTHPGARVIATSDAIPDQWPPLQVAAFMGKVRTLKRPLTVQALESAIRRALEN